MTTLLTDLTILEKYYDIVRVIDPLATASLPPAVCGLWDCYHLRNSAPTCKNCVSLQAIQQKETFSKMEVRKGKFYMITAIPLELDGRTVALELIKCVSEKTVENFLPMPGKGTNLCRSIAKLNDLAIKDALTNIFNRRYINEQLPLEISLAKQHNQPFSIVMADIDYFKQINDQYGHLVGDEVLKLFATQLQNNIRTNNGDWIARYGGEEFLIVLNNCLESPAYKITEKFRKIIEQTPFTTSAGQLHITASFGVHTFSGQENDLRQLFDKVDSQLYHAKQAGRNCTAATNRKNFSRNGFTGNGVNHVKKLRRF
ncbi:GGDEF domain-containing protein [Sporomusa sp. KB1]|uniref:GGDEF domain-containing protein n=1 Tax=Sporomusa sp. KB1 TaxID=943346 RepID=UPI00119F9AF5|nr:GGDEF domain-containing protein [Sporomusa sp. KB1]TWH45473.1 diguanylate cyclase (GGDEF)-like protein [Sporomusa sp. KB1]